MDDNYWDRRWSDAAHNADKAKIEQLSYEAVLKIVGTDEKKSVIDFGCGIGRWMRFWCDLGWDYTGFDNSLIAITKVKQRFPDSKWISELTGTETFDYVFCCTVLIHCQDKQSVAKKLMRLTKPGGSLLLIESTWDKIFIERAVKQQSDNKINPHMAYHTMDQFMNLFDSFDVISVTSLYDTLSLFHFRRPLITEK